MTKIFRLLILLIMCVFFPGVDFLFSQEISTGRLYKQKNNVNQESAVPVRIGYFHGGRVHCLYRAYIYNFFDKENVDIELYTQYLSDDKFLLVPKQSETLLEKKYKDFGRVSGERIIKAIEAGILDGGTPGESSFVQAVNNGSPIVAVALLGHDNKDKPGKAFLLRKDVVIKTPRDFIGKKFGTRRAGPGDKIFLSEFFRSIGLDPQKDVTIIDQIPDNQQGRYLKEGKIDGILHHLHGGINKIEDGQVYLYRPMNWINPEISHAVLVFRKDFLARHPKDVEKVVRAYMKRIKYEQNLSEDQKAQPQDFGLQIQLHYEGMSLPQFDYPPLVRLDLLESVQELLLNYKVIDKRIDLNGYIDNSLVKKIYEEIK